MNSLEGVTLAFSSLYQIGDSQNINAVSKAYAVQREKEFFLTSEGTFDSEVFTSSIDLPRINPNIKVSRLNLCPIKVNSMYIRATAFSSIIHIGNTCNVYMEGRVKNIRQLEKGKEQQNFENIEEPN
ncbi:spore germination protein GerPE [Bacillus sp. NTK074B]|uniref:spore germination protein GerPE n=1 Tax=Bacillus sp. NTK074B TaxID=2802174 RepID=UPI001A90C994|nr:spore germination protein GerPE [Bacillus sp. NTK074B]